MEGSEPFPLLNTSADHFHAALPDQSAVASAAARRRRQSSAIGQDIRAGDTGAALATSKASLAASDRSDHSQRVSKRRRARGFLARIRQAMIRRTYLLPTVLLAVFGFLYALDPSEKNPVHRFIFLSYPIEAGSDHPLAPPPGSPVHYGKGINDLALVAFYTIVLSFTREFIMQEILKPLARRAGIRSRAKQARFMEQAYTAIYFAFLGPAGMYVMRSSPIWYYNTRGMYENFPHRTHEAGFKFYYLFQAAYWAQQAIVLVLGMEKPRKDFKELVGHHIVTLTLIGLSYRFHFTYMGLAVYTTHDISDFFLAISKLLNYVDSPIVGPFFFLFVVVWIYMRHYLNLKILWSMFNEYKTVGPYTLDWAAEQYKSSLSNYITLGLLSSLQALNLFWLFFIIRVAYRFIRDRAADDDRSEAEDDDEEDEAVEVEVVGAAGVADQKNKLHSNGHASANGHALSNGSVVKARTNGVTK